METEHALLITTGGTLILAIITLISNEIKERRNRRWIEEDRAASVREIIEKAAAEAEAVRIRAESAAKHLEQQARKIAAEVKEDQRINTALIEERLDTVGKAASHAYEEANNVKTDIKNLNARLLGQGAVRGQLDDIEIKADSIEKKVEEIREKIV